MAKQLTNGKKTLFALGDAKFSSSSPIRGHVRSPLKKFTEVLKQHGDVIEIDEYLTSQLCSHCFRRLVKTTENTKDR